MSQTANYISLPKIGRIRLYRILRILSIVSENNKPAKQYIDMGLFKIGKYKYPVKKSRRYVALIVGYSGLNFVKRVAADYLKDNPVPVVHRNKPVKS